MINFGEVDEFVVCKVGVVKCYNTHVLIYSGICVPEIVTVLGNYLFKTVSPNSTKLI